MAHSKHIKLENFKRAGFIYEQINDSDLDWNRYPPYYVVVLYLIECSTISNYKKKICEINIIKFISMKHDIEFFEIGHASRKFAK